MELKNVAARLDINADGQRVELCIGRKTVERVGVIPNEGYALREFEPPAERRCINVIFLNDARGGGDEARG